MKEHLGDKPFVCLIGDCQKRFSQYASFTKHMKYHDGETPYKCDICEKSFSQLSNLKRHEKLHSGEKPFACEQCEKSFSNLSNLKQHQLTHAEEDERVKFNCLRCGKEYLYQNSLSKHMRSHARKDAKAALKKAEPKKKSKRTEKKQSKAHAEELEMPKRRKQIKKQEEVVFQCPSAEAETNDSKGSESSVESDYVMRYGSFDLTFGEPVAAKKRTVSSFLEMFEESKPAQELDFFEGLKGNKADEEVQEKGNRRFVLDFDFFDEPRITKDNVPRKSFDELFGIDYKFNELVGVQAAKERSFVDDLNNNLQMKSNFEDFLQVGASRRSRPSSFLSQIEGSEGMIF